MALMIPLLDQGGEQTCLANGTAFHNKHFQGHVALCIEKKSKGLAEHRNLVFSMEMKQLEPKT
jgi:hypothetical protein